jgi:hypothetical protein
MDVVWSMTKLKKRHENFVMDQRISCGTSTIGLQIFDSPSWFADVQYQLVEVLVTGIDWRRGGDRRIKGEDWRHVYTSYSWMDSMPTRAMVSTKHMLMISFMERREGVGLLACCKLDSPHAQAGGQNLLHVAKNLLHVATAVRTKRTGKKRIAGRWDSGQKNSGRGPATAGMVGE